jgi:hypothetical protein
MTYTEDPLLAALRRLTRWEPVPTVQDTAAGPRVRIVHHAPLLQQLEVAAAGAMGSHAGTVAAGLDSTRLPGNWAAIALRDEIRAALAAWDCPEWEDLHAHLHWAGRQHAQGLLSDRDWAGLHSRIRGWADRIDALFDPPRTVPLDVVCPRCGNRWGREPAHGDRVDAIAVLYTMDGDQVRSVRAECRVPECATVWDGRDGVRAMVDAADVRARYGVAPYALSPEEWAELATALLAGTRV